MTGFTQRNINPVLNPRYEQIIRLMIAINPAKSKAELLALILQVDLEENPECVGDDRVKWDKLISFRFTQAYKLAIKPDSRN